MTILCLSLSIVVQYFSSLLFSDSLPIVAKRFSFDECADAKRKVPFAGNPANGTYRYTVLLQFDAAIHPSAAERKCIYSFASLQVGQIGPTQSNFLLSSILDGCLCRRQSGDGHSEGGTRDVIESDFVAEVHGGGISSLFAADAQFQIGAYGSSEF